MEATQLPCAICGESFDSKRELLEHQRTVHAAVVLERAPQSTFDKETEEERAA